MTKLALSSLLIIVLGITLLGFSTPAFATTGTASPDTFYTGEYSGGDNAFFSSYRLFTLDGLTQTFLPGVAQWIAGALAAIAVVFLVYAGIQYLTAQGDEDKITKAGMSAFYVIVALFLLMFAYVLVALFLGIFGGVTGEQLPPPSPSTAPLAPQIQRPSPL